MATGIFAVGVDLVEEAGLQNRRLEHAVTAVQVADDQELVLPIGPRREDVDVTVEKRRLSGELFEAALACQLAGTTRALGLEELARLIDQAQIGRELLLDQVGVVVVLERIEEGVKRSGRRELSHLLDLDLAACLALVDHLHAQIGLEERGQLTTELQLRWMSLAIGHEKLVNGREQRLLPGLVEGLHELETLLLEPRVDEGA